MTATPPFIRTRFAPSPTGELHLGHAYSALIAHDFAQENDGDFLVRIEDIDQTRCKRTYEDQIIRDLKNLNLKFSPHIRRQSDHYQDYQLALDKLHNMGLLYPCFCTRKEIQAEIKNSLHAPHNLQHGPEGALYPHICRGLTLAEIEDKHAAQIPFSLRLNMDKALQEHIASPLIWHDLIQGEQATTAEILGDVILARKDNPTSYHLSVVVDDALQGISHVIRGEDLFYATHLHRLLQHLLDLPTPLYIHHPLITDEQGKKFSKRDKSLTLKSLWEENVDIRHRLNQSLRDFMKLL